jgi:hypothetical protein
MASMLSLGSLQVKPIVRQLKKIGNPTMLREAFMHPLKGG